jgi:hypothetical protein
MIRKYRNIEEFAVVLWDGKEETALQLAILTNHLKSVNFNLLNGILYKHFDSEIIDINTYIVIYEDVIKILTENEFKSKFTYIENDNIPIDANNIEVFSIQNNGAFVGYKNKTGDFHYKQYPITDPNYKDIKKLNIPNVCFSLTSHNDKREEMFQKQRIERGFDDSETWSLRDTIANFIIPRLERYNEITKEVLDGPEHIQNCAFILNAFKLITRNEGECIFSDYEKNTVKNGLKLFSEIFMELWW